MTTFLVALAMTVAALPSTPIRIKTHELTFNGHDAFALVDGKIWFRPLSGGEWALLGKTGLPESPNVADEEDPSKVIAIAADANALIAIGADRRIYDAVLEDASAGKLRWNYEWGFPWRMMPAKVFLPEDIRTWTYSLMNSEAGYTLDIDGNPHRIIGVDTLWALARDGRSIRFDDPWLPPNQFELAISSPERGQFAIASLSASASTLFVMDRSGRMFTRHCDFDTLGGNPGIGYSYRRYRPDDFVASLRSMLPMLLDVRSLPPEDWRAQPAIPGRFTGAITIVQTGMGNAARELRVEGWGADGSTGHWKKALFDEAWTFEPTGQPLIGSEILPGTAPEPTDSTDECFAGTALFGHTPANIRAGTMPSTHMQPTYAPPGDYITRASLEGFNLLFNPMTVHLESPKGLPLSFTVHMRPYSFPIRSGGALRLAGAITLAKETEEDPERKRAALSLPGIVPITDAYIFISDDVVKIEADPFAQVDGGRVELRFPRPATPARGAEALPALRGYRATTASIMAR